MGIFHQTRLVMAFDCLKFAFQPSAAHFIGTYLSISLNNGVCLAENCFQTVGMTYYRSICANLGPKKDIKGGFSAQEAYYHHAFDRPAAESIIFPYTYIRWPKSTGSCVVRHVHFHKETCLCWVTMSYSLSCVFKYLFTNYIK